MTTKQNPKFPEGINTSQEQPLKEFFLLVTGVVLTIVVFVACVTYFAQALSPYIPFAWEKSWVSSVVIQADEAEEENQIMQEAQIALQDLLHKLAPQNQIDISYNVQLLDDDTPNAFATLGGQIFVTTGLIKNIKSENGLAMVLAHEMAHIQHRHPIQSLSRGLIIQLVSAMIFSDSSAGTLLNQAGLITLLRFNRDMEREADTSALRTIGEIYGHTQGADEFFTAMLNEHGNDLSVEFFNTHPNTQSRIDALRSNPMLHGKLTPLTSSLSNIKNKF
ncbi:M48 family metallopeptidase [Bermanella sp. WJH001]|uniref:M48 family metallopeptidase n=1 Tax=Bermanella sp. WJH001 TaxID=3048005 RepID=UPI0024BEB7C5|nr:M48 family metallopeptidase [Bermanella sp. WJH001]MDJ1538374.1 M48 family metallopeptidase [Bermanella sp. WJH001]